MNAAVEAALFGDVRVLPANFGPHRGATHDARHTGPCGDTMEFWLTIADGILQRVTYTTDGCGHANLCGAVCAHLARGRSVHAAGRLTQAEVLAAIGDLPEESQHCALLAVTALRAALAAPQGRPA